MSSPMKILVVEDDEDCRFVYGEFLRAAGYESFEVENANRGLEWLKTAQARPALVILDLTLPGMPAAEFVQQIRAEPAYSQTKILLLSGRHDLADQARAIGADGFVKKPCDLVPLTKEVNRLMAKASTTS